MLSQDLAIRPQPVPTQATDDAELQLPLELLELELSLEGFEKGPHAFPEAVRRAASAASGEFLFDLPSAGLIADCRHIAVIRIPGEDDEMHIVLALLDENGTEIRLQHPDEETEHLVHFADAFIDLVQLLPLRDAA